MKRILITLLSVVLLLSLISCNTQKYRDDQAVAELAGKAVTALNDGVTYLPADSGYLSDYLTKPDYVTEEIIFFATETNNLNEFGIFHVQDGNAEAMKELLKGYLKQSLEKNQTWYDSYIPEETPKLRDAEVQVYGNYVVYAILGTDDRATLFDSIKDTLSTDN